ncbi:hypothetical protein [Hyphomonas sp.]|uniref:hypothetical protein n=1 Tax=Hyphomonas sp. TaxID=87 RepID=UPI000C4877E2|nr:hypothetical protein [Hyphomonas sp.]MAB09695.1 hypothetical protein [Hyphomonas sp.]MAU65869.1 hypothetical protein [Hyphomonas sp.]MBM56909.1 hypothetical protein [Hyphomonas sp.]|tara:strand:+ start:148 stop:567 length:420 start_codon:yes stop_codon:yes gene_type:complete
MANSIEYERNFAVFDADLPDDTVFSETGDISIPGGHALVQILASRLNAAGWQTTNPVQHEYYGWAFFVRQKQRKYWLLLQTGSSWLLICEPMGLFQKRAGLSSFLSALDRVLKATPIITKLSWHTRQDYEQGEVDRAKP